MRTGQPWESHAVPVRRPVRGEGGHVVAYSEELAWWIRGPQVFEARPWPRDCLDC